MLEFAAVFILISLILTALALIAWWRWYQLRRAGALARAHVTHRWIAPLGMTRLYYVMYEFEGKDAQGDLFYESSHAIVEKARYDELEMGMPLFVRYSRRRPGIFTVEGQPMQHWFWTRAALIAWAYAGFIMLVGG